MGDQAVLVFETRDAAAVSDIVQRIADDIAHIPHPEDEDDGLPNYIDVGVKDEFPSIRFDIKDYGPEFAPRIMRILRSRTQAVRSDVLVRPPAAYATPRQRRGRGIIEDVPLPPSDPGPAESEEYRNARARAVAARGDTPVTRKAVSHDLFELPPAARRLVLAKVDEGIGWREFIPWFRAELESNILFREDLRCYCGVLLLPREWEGEAVVRCPECGARFAVYGRTDDWVWIDGGDIGPPDIPRSAGGPAGESAPEIDERAHAARPRIRHDVSDGLRTRWPQLWR